VITISSILKYSESNTKIHYKYQSSDLDQSRYVTDTYS